MRAGAREAQEQLAKGRHHRPRSWRRSSRRARPPVSWPWYPALWLRSRLGRTHAPTRARRADARAVRRARTSPPRGVVPQLLLGPRRRGAGVLRRAGAALGQPQDRGVERETGPPRARGGLGHDDLVARCPNRTRRSRRVQTQLAEEPTGSVRACSATCLPRARVRRASEPASKCAQLGDEGAFNRSRRSLLAPPHRAPRALRRGTNCLFAGSCTISVASGLRNLPAAAAAAAGGCFGGGRT